MKYIVKAVFFIDRIPNDFMQGFDKRAVTDKLNEMGLGDVAKKLNTLSDGELERMIRQNPQILRKAAEMMKGGFNGK